MNLTKETKDDTLIVKASGWLDIQSNREFSEFVGQIPIQKKLVLDLDGLEYISSSGVREIVTIILRQPKGTFSIINVSPAVYTVFEMVGLNKKIDIQSKK